MGLMKSFFGMKSNGEEALKRAFGVAYAKEGEMLTTRIPWYEAEKFIKSRGKDINVWDDGGMSGSVHMLINREEITITLTKHRMNGSTLVWARNTENER